MISSAGKAYRIVILAILLLTVAFLAQWYVVAGRAEFNRSDASTGAITPHPILIQNGLHEGEVISSNVYNNDFDIFIVNIYGYKRLFINPTIFSMYGHLRYADVNPVTPAVRDGFPTSGIFKNCETGDPTLYVLEVLPEGDFGILHHLAIDMPTLLLEDSQFFKKVFCINNNEFNWYPKSSFEYASLSQLPPYAYSRATPTILPSGSSSATSFPSGTATPAFTATSTPSSSPTAHGDNAQCVTTALSITPTYPTAGTQIAVFLRMRNTGTTTWTSPDYQLLGWDGSVYHLPDGSQIEPGQSVTIPFTAVAPQNSGTQSLSWIMVYQGMTFPVGSECAKFVVVAKPYLWSPQDDSTDVVVGHPAPTPTPSGSMPPAIPPVSGGICTAGGDTSGCREGFCSCELAVSKAVNGKPVDMDAVNAKAGSDDPRSVFTGGGSENIPVACRTAKYIVEKDPKWFTGYFDVQLTGSIGLFGDEMFAPGYFHVTVNNIIAVHNKALQYGHAELAQKSAKWLRAYWSILSLASVQEPVKKYETYQVDRGTLHDEVNYTNPEIVSSYGTVMPGNRAYVNDYPGGVGFQNISLAMALGDPGRKFDKSLDGGVGAYGGLCAAVKTQGYTVSGGRINISYSPEASKFGLTDDERKALADFIISKGTVGLEKVVSYLSGYHLPCELSIIRTDQAISAWFGNTSDRVGLCSRAKGGTFVAGTLTYLNSTATYLSRALHDFYPEAATTWVEDGKICEETALLSKRCIPLAKGITSYHIRWPRGGEIQIVTQ